MKPSRRARPRVIADRIDDALLGYEAATPHLTMPLAAAVAPRRRRRARAAATPYWLMAFAAAVTSLAMLG